MEVFGETPFAPRKKEEALALTKKQEELLLSQEEYQSQIAVGIADGLDQFFAGRR